MAHVLGDMHSGPHHSHRSASSRHLFESERHEGPDTSHDTGGQRYSQVKLSLEESIHRVAL